MAYTCEHVRFTLECDACGLVEKRDMDAESAGTGCAGWDEVRTQTRSAFCCPSCVQSVLAILGKHAREQREAKAAIEANCAHDYQPRGLLAQCTKCQKWKGKNDV